MVGKEVIGDFEVEVFEDTYITAVHCKYGHKYSARWSTEVPHLRNEHCAPNDLAERDGGGPYQCFVGALAYLQEANCTAKNASHL